MKKTRSKKSRDTVPLNGVVHNDFDGGKSISRGHWKGWALKIEMAEIVYSDAWGKLIHEKNQKSKIS